MDENSNKTGTEPLIPKEQRSHKYTNAELMDLMDMGDIQKGNEATEKLVNKFGYVNGLAAGINSDINRGVHGSDADLDERRRIYGDNKPIPRKIKGFCDIVCDQLKDLFVILLCVAAVVSLIVGVLEQGWKEGWLDGVSILVAVSIITGVNTINEWKQKQKFQSLMQKMDESMSTVIRNGETYEIPSEELVVGDVMNIRKDYKIVADCVIIDSTGLACEEGDLTGEPDARYKKSVDVNTWNEDVAELSPCPFLLKGAKTVKGTGRALVVCVGRSTNQGQAGQAMDFEDEDTPLQEKLGAVVEIIGWIGIGAAGLTFIAMTIRLICTIFVQKERDIKDQQNINDLLQALIIAVSVVVMAVPEGLPMAVSIAISFSVNDLQKEGNLVRKPDASETMGGCHYICTDKTGTLTTNCMTVRSTFIGGQRIDGEKIEKNNYYKTLEMAILWNSTASEVKDSEGKIDISGDPTERALIKFVKNCCTETNVMDYQNSLKDSQIYAVPFDPDFKYMSTCVRLADGSVRLLVKGAAEKIDISHMLDAQGEKIPFDQEGFETVRVSYAKSCFRNISIAMAEYSAEEWAVLEAEHKGFDTIEDRRKMDKNLTLIAMVGIVDPLRPGIKEAVQTHARAGVRTIMVTGDNIQTAISIAYQAGILTDEDMKHVENNTRNVAEHICMEGANFEKLTEGYVREKRDGDDKEHDYIKNGHEFNKILKHLKVMARCKPTHKFLLVTGLIERKKVVAVTGDGTNDAPALARADVGIAMGTGSDAAKDASKIVLLNDDFCATLATVKFGRNIYDSVRKFLQFQLTINVVAMLLVFLGASIFGEDVLTSVQILWVNLIMDTFAALALATEPPSDELLLRQPQDRDESIINAQMWRNIAGWSFAQIILVFVVLIWGQDIFDLPYAAAEKIEFIDDVPTNKLIVYTISFQTFVFMQLFNQINARKLGKPADPKQGVVATETLNVFEGFFNNPLFLIITLGTFAAQFAIVYLGGEFLRVAPLTLNQNMLALGFGFFMLPWTLVVKQIPSAWFSGCKMNEAPLGESSSASVFSRRVSMSISKKAKKVQKELELEQAQLKGQQNQINN